MRTHIRRSIAAAMPKATSVFIGGGTPTLVPADELMSVLAEIPLAPGAEVTVECNPDDITLAMMQTFRDGGVNRVSIGVQSTVDRVLKSLGRTHNPENVSRSVSYVREAGFQTFNLDLIYGAAVETIDDWSRTISDVVALNPPHLSAYGLTVEANTVLATQPDRHPDDDDQADKYLICDDALSVSGLKNYEISNWAKPGGECEHNQAYWTNANWWGIGPGAHSHLNGRRWVNHKHPATYAQALSAGESLQADSEELTPEQIHVETVMLALRTRSGLDIGELNSEEVNRAKALAGQGMIHAQGLEQGVIQITDAGRLFADRVIRELLG